MGANEGLSCRHQPVPGNMVAIGHEISRLEQVRDLLQSAGATTRGVSTEFWSGAAKDAFTDKQHVLGRRWRDATDAHDDAARALEDYRATLEELQRRVRDTLPDLVAAGGTAADDAVVRWNEQLRTQGVVAARALRRAKDELDAVRTIFAEPAVPPTTRTVSPTPRAPRSRHSRLFALDAELRTATAQHHTNPHYSDWTTWASERGRRIGRIAPEEIGVTI